MCLKTNSAELTLRELGSLSCHSVILKSQHAATPGYYGKLLGFAFANVHVLEEGWDIYSCNLGPVLK